MTHASVVRKGRRVMAYLPIFKTIVSSLFKKTPTVEYPFKPMVNDPLVRGQVGIDVGNCIFCGLCARRCPTDAIKTSKDSKSWEIARFQCIVCNACVEVCPKKCLVMKPELTRASGMLVNDKVSADTVGG